MCSRLVCTLLSLIALSITFECRAQWLFSGEEISLLSIEEYRKLEPTYHGGNERSTAYGITVIVGDCMRIREKGALAFPLFPANPLMYEKLETLYIATQLFYQLTQMLPPLAIFYRECAASVEPMLKTLVAPRSRL